MGSMKKQMKKNVIQLHGKAVKTADFAYREGVKEGFKNISAAFKAGYEEGRKDGIEEGVKASMDGVIDATELMWKRLDSLREVPDIGKKRFQAIMEHLGRDIMKNSTEGQ